MNWEEEASKKVKRACRYCRERKIRCQLDSSERSARCRQCIRDDRSCEMAPSRRGGARIKGSPDNASGTKSHHYSVFRIADDSCSHDATTQSSQHATSPFEDRSNEGNPPSIIFAHPNLTRSRSNSIGADAVPANPSDAWQLLTSVVGSQAQPEYSTQSKASLYGDVGTARDARQRSDTVQGNLGSFALIRSGYLTTTIVKMLVSRYLDNYHPYLPIAPSAFFNMISQEQCMQSERHLLTAILTVASKDLENLPTLHKCIAQHMRDLISDIAGGNDCDVEAVEALLILAEWEPHGLRLQYDEVGRGEEDRSAWMHTGLALRCGYFIGLDQTAFEQDGAAEKPDESRRRLAWATCYIADRLVSVRIGRAFWSRGPGPTTHLSEQVFSSLQATGEDYNLVFQATLELTQLYSNVHDVLYSGMKSKRQMMLMGDYVKYVDDFRTGLNRWQQKWSEVGCSKRLKTALHLSFEYLSLYTNAFVFQAAIAQAIASRPSHATSLRSHLSATFDNIGTMADARFIFASVQAATNYLTSFTTELDAVEHLRYMPTRYYLFCIYCSVFLHKAFSFGVIKKPEAEETRGLIYMAIAVLKKSAVTAQDPGWRYATLLELLWEKPNTNGGNKERSQNSSANDSILRVATNPPDQLQSDSPATFNAPNGISWLDLEAVGHIASEYYNSAASATESIPFSAPMASVTTSLDDYGLTDGFWDGYPDLIDNFLF